MEEVYDTWMVFFGKVNLPLGDFLLFFLHTY